LEYILRNYNPGSIASQSSNNVSELFYAPDLDVRSHQVDSSNEAGIIDLSSGPESQGKREAVGEAIHLQALKRDERILGSDHGLILREVNDLGGLYRIHGKLVQAENMYQRALKGYERTLGLEHISTLDTVSKLGNIYELQNKLAEAKEMYQRALQGYEKLLGSNHASTLAILNSLDNLYDSQDKPAGDEDLSQRGLQAKEKAPGPE
jgi:tetratricopeptide (TPR) repeat protein